MKNLIDVFNESLLDDEDVLDFDYDRCGAPYLYINKKRDPFGSLLIFINTFIQFRLTLELI